MSIRGMPSVEDQPTVTLIRWRVLRIKVKKVSIDFVLGWCLEDGHARMSTPIKHHDAVARTLITKSRQVYVLEGAPDYDDDAQYIAEEHFGSAAAKAKDVSAEYFNDVIHVAHTIHNVALDTVVSLSGQQSGSFISDMDKPFQPNAKLVNTLKRQRSPKNE